ncbi:MAG: hypothetical protein HY352_05535 [Candidatus Omnitrophica bacterium]|nr:hypothetical protein [Candidatus Omnitrophota bacterium]
MTHSGKVSTVVVFGIPAMVVCGGMLYVRQYPETPVAIKLVELKDRGVELLDMAKQHLPGYHAQKPAAKHARSSTHPANGPVTFESVSKTPATSTPAKPATPMPRATTLYLKNGGAVTGELVSETSQEVTLHFEYGDVGFQRAEIARIVKGQQGTGEDGMVMPWEGAHKKLDWPYQHDVVVRLLKGTVVDGDIRSVTPKDVVVTQAVPGGGEIEHTIHRADIDQLMFKPVKTKDTEAIEEKLRTLFPKMSWNEEGLFTIVSDSIPPTIKEYRKTIRELATDWYLTFLPLVKHRKPIGQRYIVVFDDWQAYIDYAATDGVPGWMAVGYYDPEQDVLYCFNMLGDRFSQLLYDAYLGQFNKARKDVSQEVQGSRYEVFVEGAISEFYQKLEQAHSSVRQIFAQFSTDVLRHELTHSMFANWKLQGVILSKLPSADKDKDVVEKKQRYLQATNATTKRQMLDDLLSSQKQHPLPEMQASNSWFVEGLAGYMEPSPVGGINSERLAEVQEAKRTTQLLPFAYLNTFRVGSFPGLSSKSMLYAYAQSWAFCHFLMAKYPEGFMTFQDRMIRETPGDQGIELTWFTEAIGKDQHTLDEEFAAYLEQFPPEDSLPVKQMKAFLDLRDELTTLARRYGG